MRPAICDGSGPVTRFSATALADGWLKVTLCWLPTSKLFQSIAARWLDWVIWVLAGGPADRRGAGHHGTPGRVRVRRRLRRRGQGRQYRDGGQASLQGSPEQ